VILFPLLRPEKSGEVKTAEDAENSDPKK
jgi:hypothetical protein